MKATTLLAETLMSALLAVPMFAQVAPTDEKVSCRNYKDVLALFYRLGYTEKTWQAGIREIPRVYLADHASAMDLDSVLKTARESGDQRFLAWFDSTMTDVRAQLERQSRSSVREALVMLLDLADHGIAQLVEKQRAIVGHLVKSPQGLRP